MLNLSSKFYKYKPHSREMLYFLLFVVIFILLGAQSLLMIMGCDHLGWHYSAYKMTHWGQYPYRDFYDFQFFGLYLYHAAIQFIFGYSDLGFRIFDILNHIIFCLTLWITLKYLIEDIDRKQLLIILILVTVTYYGLGWWWTGQKESFLMTYIFWSFYFYKKGYVDDNIGYAILSGALNGIVFSIKPFYVIYLVLFTIIHLLFNYPYPGSLKKRIKTISLNYAGSAILIIIMILYMHYLGILSYFITNAIPHAIEFKKFGSPLSWNIFSMFFFCSPAVGFIKIPYQMMYAALIVVSFIFIIVAFIKKESRVYYILSLMFFLSIALLLYQKNGEVINHHIPLVVVKSILSSLFIYQFFNYMEKYIRLIAKKHVQLITNILIIFTLGVVSYPFISLCYDSITMDLIKGKITLEEYRRKKYPSKAEEDVIANYITQNIDREKDEILFFCYSYYIQYHTRAKSIYRFNNNLAFVMTPAKSYLYKRFSNELVSEVIKHPPRFMVINWNDTTWGKFTSFKEWTTSYDMLIKMPQMKDFIEKNYTRTLMLESYWVYARK